MVGTDVEVRLIFNETSSEPLPSTEDVAETLVTAVTSPNSTVITQFNLTLVAASIRVTSKLIYPFAYIIGTVYMCLYVPVCICVYIVHAITT